MGFTWGKEGSGSPKGPRNGEGGSGEQGPSISRLLHWMLEQAASKACNLHQLNIAGRGLAGPEEQSSVCVEAACPGWQGAGVGRPSLSTTERPKGACLL